MRWFLASLLAASIASAAGGCSVGDGLIDDKKCDPNAPKDRQCVKGYIPVQEQEGCFCRPISTSPLRGRLPAVSPIASQPDPSTRLLRRLGVLEQH